MTDEKRIHRGTKAVIGCVGGIIGMLAYGLGAEAAGIWIIACSANLLEWS